jgi:hypothetical protein
MAYLSFGVLGSALLVVAAVGVTMIKKNRMLRMLVMVYMTATPLLYNKFIYLWFYDSGQVLGLAYRIICLPFVLVIFFVSLTTKGKLLRIP